MDIEQKIKESWFTDHVADYKKINDRISILDWGNPGTVVYRVRYVFDGNRLYISGDLGEAVFRLTWKGNPKSFKDINIHYFHEKLSAYGAPKYDFDSELAIKELKETIEDYKNDGLDDGELTPFKKIIP